jgi:hypothetical protein
MSVDESTIIERTRNVLSDGKATRLSLETRSQKMAMKHGHENWKMYHMEETTTKTEQKRKMITLTEKQDNKKQSIKKIRKKNLTKR